MSSSRHKDHDVGKWARPKKTSLGASKEREKDHPAAAALSLAPLLDVLKVEGGGTETALRPVVPEFNHL